MSRDDPNVNTFTQVHLTSTEHFFFFFFYSITSSSVALHIVFLASLYASEGKSPEGWNIRPRTVPLYAARSRLGTGRADDVAAGNIESRAVRFFLELRDREPTSRGRSLLTRNVK